MSEKIKRIYAIIPVVAATVTIIVAIVGGISLKNENALLNFQYPTVSAVGIP